ncbi:MAG: hypothetical protein A2V86_12150 [Deltaproteobacteria bacterium RBG_16_49_23]|nr:MAG: hypothetical protein A2V86_12150 [Deltaproteobacteria bacterium RBG_16_49_23]
MKQGILILLLLCFALFLVFKNYEIWDSSYEKGAEKEPLKKVEKKTEPAPPLPPGQQDRSSQQSSISIADKNIFNPERKDFPAPILSEKLKLGARPQMILYGVVIGEDYQFASVAVTGKPPQKGERSGGETRTLKVGESIGEYKLNKILPDRIVMEAPEDTFEVLLHDQNVAKGRSNIRTENRPAMITSITPTPVTSVIPTTVPSASRVSPLPPAVSGGGVGEPFRGRSVTTPAPAPVAPVAPVTPVTPARPPSPPYRK